MFFLSEFKKLKKKFLEEKYKFIKTDKKDFGERIIAERKSGFLRRDKRVLIHHFIRPPTVKDFAKFVKDFEQFNDEFSDEYDIVCAYFVMYGEYDKEGFDLIRERLSKDIRDRIVITTFKEEAMPNLREVIQKIKGFRPHKQARKERELENMLVHYLSAFYPNIKTQLTYERARIDAQIGKIGIEIKYQPSAGEFDRLYGQIEKYLKHLDYVIAVIGYEKSKESTRDFRQRLKERDWLNNRVFVISLR